MRPADASDAEAVFELATIMAASPTNALSQSLAAVGPALPGPCPPKAQRCLPRPTRQPDVLAIFWFQRRRPSRHTVEPAGPRTHPVRVQAKS